MNPHFFTAPFYFAFIWFRVQGSGLSWRLRRLFLEDGILVSQPSPLGKAIKLSGRTFLAPHRGAARWAEGAALRYIPHCSITASMPHLAALACAAHYS